jgi:RNA polymerase sigma-70 factor (ECF subfamily)
LDLIWERSLVDVDGTLDRPVDSQEACEDRTEVADAGEIRASLDGNSEAYRRLVERYQGYVSRILWRFSRDRQVHEELVQDVFVEAYLSLGGFKGTAPFSHWLSRIATRVGYHYWKKTARGANPEGLAPEQWHRLADGQTDQIQANEAAALVQRLLGQLPPRDRLVLTLRYLEECDVAETARRTGWTQTMVKVQTLRAKKKLEKVLRRYEGETLS